MPTEKVLSGFFSGNVEVCERKRHSMFVQYFSVFVYFLVMLKTIFSSFSKGKVKKEKSTNKYEFSPISIHFPSKIIYFSFFPIPRFSSVLKNTFLSPRGPPGMPPLLSLPPGTL